MRGNRSFISNRTPPHQSTVGMMWSNFAYRWSSTLSGQDNPSTSKSSTEHTLALTRAQKELKDYVPTAATSPPVGSTQSIGGSAVSSSRSRNLVIDGEQSYGKRQEVENKRRRRNEHYDGEMVNKGWTERLVGDAGSRLQAMSGAHYSDTFLQESNETAKALEAVITARHSGSQNSGDRKTNAVDSSAWVQAKDFEYLPSSLPIQRKMVAYYRYLRGRDLEQAITDVHDIEALTTKSLIENHVVNNNIGGAEEDTSAIEYQRDSALVAALRTERLRLVKEEIPELADVAVAEKVFRRLDEAFPTQRFTRSNPSHESASLAPSVMTLLAKSPTGDVSTNHSAPALDKITKLAALITKSLRDSLTRTNPITTDCFYFTLRRENVAFKKAIMTIATRLNVKHNSFSASSRTTQGKDNFTLQTVFVTGVPEVMLLSLNDLKYGGLVIKVSDIRKCSLEDWAVVLAKKQTEQSFHTGRHVATTVVLRNISATTSHFESKLDMLRSEGYINYLEVNSSMKQAATKFLRGDRRAALKEAFTFTGMFAEMEAFLANPTSGTAKAAKEATQCLKTQNFLKGYLSLGSNKKAVSLTSRDLLAYVQDSNQWVPNFLHYHWNRMASRRLRDAGGGSMTPQVGDLVARPSAVLKFGLLAQDDVMRIESEGDLDAYIAEILALEEAQIEALLDSPDLDDRSKKYDGDFGAMKVVSPKQCVVLPIPHYDQTLEDSLFPDIRGLTFLDLKKSIERDSDIRDFFHWTKARFQEHHVEVASRLGQYRRVVQRPVRLEWKLLRSARQLDTMLDPTAPAMLMNPDYIRTSLIQSQPLTDGSPERAAKILSSPPFSLRPTTAADITDHSYTSNHEGLRELLLAGSDDQEEDITTSINREVDDFEFGSSDVDISDSNPDRTNLTPTASLPSEVATDESSEIFQKKALKFGKLNAVSRNFTQDTEPVAPDVEAFSTNLTAALTIQLPENTPVEIALREHFALHGVKSQEDHQEQSAVNYQHLQLTSSVEVRRGGEKADPSKKRTHSHLSVEKVLEEFCPFCHLPSHTQQEQCALFKFRTKMRKEYQRKKEEQLRQLRHQGVERERLPIHRSRTEKKKESHRMIEAGTPLFPVVHTKSWTLSFSRRDYPEEKFGLSIKPSSLLEFRSPQPGSIADEYLQNNQKKSSIQELKKVLDFVAREEDKRKVDLFVTQIGSREVFIDDDFKHGIERKVDVALRVELLDVESRKKVVEDELKRREEKGLFRRRSSSSKQENANDEKGVSVIQFRQAHGDEAYGAFSTYARERFMLYGREWATAEHCFQAAKFLNQDDMSIFEEILRCKRPGDAVKIADSRKEKMNPRWNEMRDEVMSQIQRAKFSPIGHLAEKLLATGDKVLQYNHADPYWGYAEGKGQNRLGEVLMDIRGNLGRGVSKGMERKDEAESEP